MIPARVAVAMLCLPLAAAAAEWTKVPTADQNQHWYDRSKIAIEGYAVTYWRRVEFRIAQPTKAGAAGSAMYRERIDCRAHMQRTLGYLLYSRDGTVIENVHKPDAEAEAIIPDTVGDRFERLMCTLATERATDPQAPYPGPPSRTAEEMRQEIDWLEARLRILRDQLQQQSKINAAPGEPAVEAR